MNTPKLVVIVGAVIAVAWYVLSLPRENKTALNSNDSVAPEKATNASVAPAIGLPEAPVQNPEPTLAIAPAMPAIPVVRMTAPKFNPFAGLTPAEINMIPNTAFPTSPIVPIAPNEPWVDTLYGVTVTPPEGWVMSGGQRWGKQETTLSFTDPEHPEARASVYYRSFEETRPFNEYSDAQMEAYMRERAVEKQKLRVSSGLVDYTNRSDMQVRVINGHPALTWTADYTQNGQRWVEHLTHIYTPTTTILYFEQAPAAVLPTIQPALAATIQATVIP